ncbi:MAG: hypothetical protein JWP94_2974 [Mucilaginibacter sp.]|nr:hypothetical protein [Mucilaginibacter sp.]
MYGQSFNAYYSDALEKAKKQILHETDTQIIGSEVDQLADFYYQRYALTPIEFAADGLAFEIKREIRTISAGRREWGYREDGDFDFEYQSAIITIPIQPNPNLELIKILHGSTRYLDGFEEAVKYNTYEVSYSFDTKWYGGNLPDDQIANQVNSISEQLIQTLASKNDNIQIQNANLNNNIKEVITQRRSQIEEDKGRLDSLTQKIRIPLKQSAQSQIKNINISPKEFVRVDKPTPKLPEQLIFDEDKLSPILDFIEFQMQSLERTPGTVKSLGEEQLRDLILSALNGAFKGDATGETFVKKGKTDIHLKIQKGEILIFECKNWGGEKIYTGTIDQLIGYVTWRQNYGVIIMFCKNRDFTKILTQIPQVIQSHAGYKNGYKKLNDAHFVSEHVFPEDAYKRIKIHHLIYNLYSEN